MIDKQTMMGPMLRACPSFERKWRRIVREWKDKAEDPPLYAALSELARHLIAMLEHGDTSLFPEIFGVVERWHVQGDDYVREAATVGLLEDLQNAHLHKKTRPEQFRTFFGPESEKWWNKLYGFWERGERLSED